MIYYSLPSLQQKVKTVILANGEFPKHEIPLAILHNSEYIVCCDGATNQLVVEHDKRKPDAIVGDCDSLTSENHQTFESIIHKVGEQETNDLTKSVKYCIEQNRKDLTILGATGKREDHTLGNISLLADYIDLDGVSVQMVTNHGVFVAIKEKTRFESFVGQQVSIFSLDGLPITSQNLKYPLNKRTLSNWWQGTLNESESDSFTLDTIGKVIVFRSFD